MNRSLIAAAAVCTWFVCEATHVRAGLITFETIPGAGAPTDGMTVNTQFQSTFGVTFSMEGGGSPILAQIGGPQTAFEGYDHLPDQPAAGVDAGQYFLTDDMTVGGPPPALIVAYTTPMSAASGIVLDIDGNEAWVVQARDSLNAVIDTLLLGPNNIQDGSATLWSFSHASADISSIRIAYCGTQPSGVGFAFDNFSQSAGFSPLTQTAAPEPSSWALFAAGVLSMAAFSRRRRTVYRHDASI